MILGQFGGNFENWSKMEAARRMNMNEVMEANRVGAITRVVPTIYYSAG